MNFRKIEQNGTVIALVEGRDVVIVDAQSALGLLMEVKYTLGTKNIAIAKEQICRDFFILSSGLAGEILQKYVNYGEGSPFMGTFLPLPANRSMTSFMKATRGMMCSSSQRRTKP